MYARENKHAYKIRYTIFLRKIVYLILYDSISYFGNIRTVRGKTLGHFEENIRTCSKEGPN